VARSTRLKNLIDARKLNERFRADESVETIDLELKDFGFLYAQGDTLIFMDLETYGQIELATDWIGERASFLQDGMKVTLCCAAAARSASGSMLP
jgi:elongation factor P